ACIARLDRGPRALAAAALVVDARRNERRVTNFLAAAVRIAATPGNGPAVVGAERDSQAARRVTPRTDVGAEQGGATRGAVDGIDTVHELFSVVDPADAPDGLTIDEGDHPVHVRPERQLVRPAGRTARLDQAVQLSLGQEPHRGTLA